MPPVVKKIMVKEAKYVKEAESIIILGTTDEGDLRTQINKSCFSYGDRSEEEIDVELEKLAKMMEGKSLNLAFDEELDAKIQCGNRLSYKVP